MRGIEQLPLCRERLDLYELFFSKSHSREVGVDTLRIQNLRHDTVGLVVIRGLDLSLV